jgi:UDPglucose 6-dehydrogenase
MSSAFITGTRETIGVIGTGYVGLVTAAGFAELGNEVWCIDIDAEKVARLRRGEIPIYEPGLKELVERHRDRLHFSTDIADALAHARLLFVAVGTPPTYSGDADLSAVHAVVDALPDSDRHALVMKSTVPVGTGASIARVFAERGKTGLRYVSCPEFLREGSALSDFFAPDRVVVGDDGGWPATRWRSCTRRCGRRSCARTSRAPRWSSSPPTRSSPRRSRSSTRSPTCASRRARTSRRWRAAWGWTTASGAASCRPASATAARASRRTSPRSSSWRATRAIHFQLLNAVIEVNELQKRRVIGKLRERLGDLAGRNVALLGLAFKPDTDDMREASSLVLAARLQADGANVRAYDPIAADQARKLLPGLEVCGSALEAMEGADAVVLVTEWPEFRRLDWRAVAARMRGTAVIDGRNALDPAAVATAGLTYAGIGRRPVAPAAMPPVPPVPGTSLSALAG